MNRQIKQTLLAMAPALLVAGVVFAQALPPSGSGTPSASSTPSNMVTTDSAQSITAIKTHTVAIRGTRFDNKDNINAGIRFAGVDIYAAAHGAGAVNFSNDNGLHGAVTGVGGFVFGVNPGAKPTCNSTNRGVLWRAEGAGGAADTLEWCCKTAADAYAWTALSTSTCA